MISGTVTTNAGAIEKTGFLIAAALPVTCRKVPLAVFSLSLLETLCAYVLMSKNKENITTITVPLCVKRDERNAVQRRELLFMLI